MGETMTWRPIEGAPKGRDEKGRAQSVLLIGHYPLGASGGPIWTDVCEGWWCDFTEDWARWTHRFPPTHFMPLPTPPDLSSAVEE